MLAPSRIEGTFYSRRLRLAILAGLFFLPLLVELVAALPPLGPDGKKKPSNLPPGVTRKQLRSDWFYKRRADPDGSIPPQARERGISQMRQLPVSRLQQQTGNFYSPLSGAIQSQTITTSWTSAGPRPIMDTIDGVTPTYGVGNASTRVNAIAVHPTDPDIVYIGTAYAGIAKSTDGGVNWTYLTDGLPSQSITTIAIDTVAPNIVYAGTGDAYNYTPRGNHLLGVGVYRSTDSGATWGRFGASNLEGYVVQKLVVDPLTSGSETTTKVYAVVSNGPDSTSRGFYKSTDSGQTWTRKNTGVGFNASAFDIALGTSSSILFFSNQTRVNKSLDGGETWFSSFGNPSANPNQNKARMAYSGSTLYFTNSTGSYSSAQAPEYSYASNGNPSVGGNVYKSSDGGASWQELTAARGFCAGQCFYDQYVGVDPTDANKVFLGGVDVSSSGNAGAYFKNFAKFNPPNMIIHSDQHSIAFAPSNTSVIYVGHDGGVNRSADGGMTWSNRNHYLPGGLIVGISQSGDGNLVAGFQDNGSKKSTGTLAWLDMASAGGDGGWAKIDAGNSQKMYHTYIVSGNVGSDLIRRTTNGGTGATDITPAAAVGAEGSEFYPYVAMDPEDSTKLYLGLHHLYGTTDSGTSWTRIGAVDSPAGASFNISCAHGAPDTAGTVYVGATDNKIYRTVSANLGNSAAWTDVSANGLPTNSVPTAIAIHPTNSSTVYVTYSNFGTVAAPRLHVYKTSDAGVTWIGVSTGLPDVPVNDIVLDTGAPNNLFIATDVGVFNSIDSGATWTRSDIGIPEGMVVQSLSFNSGTRKLAAGTYGRGAYTLTIPSPPPVPTGLGGSAHGISSVTFNWSASGAQYNVQAYGVYYTTNPTVLIASVTTPTFTFQGLLPNTSYNFQVTAANGVLESANSTSTAIVTLAVAPAAAILPDGQIYISSAQVAINDPSANPGGTYYEAQSSTDNFATVTSTAGQVGSGTDFVFFNLLANTTHYFRIRSVNFAGAPSDYTAIASTSTLLARLSTAAFSGVTGTGLTANWGSGGNGPATQYKAVISTDNFATVNSSSLTFNTSVVYTGLAGAQNYDFKVQAFGVYGDTGPYTSVVSGATSGAGPTLTAVSLVSLATYTVTGTWTSGFSAGTTYYQFASTDSAFGGVVFTSQTLNTTAATFGLSANTTYFASVSTAMTGPYTSLGSTMTMADAPLSVGFAVNLSSSYMNWGAATNPAGTRYVSQTSSDNFASVFATSVTLNTSTTFFALTANTTYYARVAALNTLGAITPFAGGAPRASYGADPASAAATTVGISSITANWLANGNPAGTRYDAALSTDAFATLNLIVNGTGLSNLFTGLSPNTTYYFASRTQGHNGVTTEGVNLPTTVTYALPPIASSMTVYTSSMILSWNANGNPAGTQFHVEFSTDGFITINESGSMPNTSASVDQNVQPNTTYYFHVRARNHAGVLTPFDATVASATPAAVPSALGLTAVGAGTVTALWGANTNAPGSLFMAQASTDPAFGTLTASSQTANTLAVFSGLSSNNTYYFQVRTDGIRGATAFTSLGSTITLLASPGLAGTTFTGVAGASVAVQWTSGGNGAGTTYLAQISTDSFGTVNASSSTLNVNAVFGTGGEGPALSANTTYYFQVKAIGASNASSFLSLGSTATPAALPVTPAVSSSTLTSLTLGWLANGNAAATVYTAQVSTDAFGTVNASSSPVGVVASFNGLTANTTYYTRVLANGFNGAVTAYVTAAASATFAAAPASAAATTVGVSSLTANWLANGNPAGTRYESAVSTDAFATINLLVSTTSILYPFSGLNANTTYYFQARALGHGGAYTASTNLPTTVTYAQPPTASSMTIHTSTMVLSWNANGNPAGTQFYVEFSTNGFVTINESGFMPDTSAEVSNVRSNATYYFHVRAMSHAGVLSAYDATVTSATFASTPTVAGLSAVGAGAVTANWGANGNFTATLYTVQAATDPAFGTLTASSQTANASAAFSGLSANSTYYFQVRTDGIRGATAFTSLGSTMTLLAPPGLAGTTFLSVSNTAAQVQWTSGGNGAGTVYVAEISTDSFGTVNASSITFSTSAIFGTGGAGPALAANTTYYFQVKSLGSGYLSLGSTATPAALPVTPAVSSSTLTSLTLGWLANGNAAATVYTAQISTDAFGTVNASSSPVGVAASFSGLTANTTYYTRVLANGFNGAVTAYATASASATFAAAPASAASTTVGTSSMTANWLANGNPAGSVYQTAVSTDDFATLNIFASTMSLLYPFSGLNANTTYYLRARVLGHGGAYTANTNLPATVSYAFAPTGSSMTVTSNTIVLSWGSNGNPAGTNFFIAYSTDNFATITNSGNDTNNSTLIDSGVLSNTTYYLRARAINHGGVATAYDTATATATFASPPAAAAPTNLSTGSVTANWLANGNSASTIYTVQLATDAAFGTLTNSAQTTALLASFSGLSSNSTYYLQVRATGHNGNPTAFVALPSTMTLLQPPAASSNTFPAVFFASATMQWATGGNGAGTVYVAQISSTSDFSAIYTSSATQTLSLLFGTGGVGSALAANTTYYGRVQTSNGVNTSTFATMGSTMTPAFAPSATTVVTVTSATVLVDWQPNGNPEPGTNYQVYYDIVAGFTAPLSATVSTSAATLSSLTPGGTYYFKVRTVGRDLTSFDAAVSTITLPPGPGKPGTPAGTTMGVSSISWTWSAASAATSHKAYRASTLAFLGSVATTLTETSLATNTAYGLRVTGINASGEGELSDGATIYTLAVPPTGSAASVITSTQATVTWGLNTNPAGTTAEVQRSTNGTIFSTVLTGTGLSYSAYDLLGCTSYYLRVRNKNGNAVATAFDTTVNFLTLGSTPSAPSSLTAESLAGNKISLSWVASPTEGVTQYKLYEVGTGTGAYGSAVAVFTSTESAYTTGALSAGLHGFALRTVHRCGVEESTGTYASAQSITTISSVRTAIKTPDAGKKVKGNSVTIVAELTSGALVDVASVTFQVKPASATAWGDVPAKNPGAHPNPDLAAPFFIQWDADAHRVLYGAGLYDLRALAMNIAGSSDTAPSSVRIELIVPGQAFDISESVGTGADIGKVVKEQVVNNAVANTVTCAGSSANDPSVKITLPAGALTNSTETVTAISNPTIATAAPAGFTFVGSALRITLGSGQENLAVSATLALSYPVGTSPSNLEIQSLNEATGVWSAIGAATTDATNRTVSAATPHFSVFAIIAGAGGAQANLSRIRVYPVPYKPNGANPNEGKPYRAGDTTSGIIFDQLPAAVKIKIYTLSGRKVAEIETNAGTGAIQWDVRNADNRDVASGGYFAVISSPGSKSVVKKLAIIR